MLTELNERLALVKEHLRKKHKYEKQLQDYSSEYKDKERKVKLLLVKLQDEKADVEKLNRLSVTNLFVTIAGKKLEKLEKEKQELLAAQLQYNEAKEALQDMEGEMNALRQKLLSVSNSEQEYQQILKEKESLIKSIDSPLTEELYLLSEREADLKAELKELGEAVHAGENVINALSSARTSLDKASNWGAWDMFGGGLLSTAIKHDHMGDAERKIHEAQRLMRIFQKELLDVEQQENLNIDVSGLLKFADFFFDGLIADWMVQGRINDTLRNVESEKSKIRNLVRELSSDIKDKEADLKNVSDRRVEILERIH